MKTQPPHGMPNFPGQPRRFYMAGTARFLTRVREAEWLGGESPYGYALENPVTYTDSSGLQPHLPQQVHYPGPTHGIPSDEGYPGHNHCVPQSPCATFPGGPCAYAKSVGTDQGDLGGIVCCDGRKYVCIWNLPSGTRPGIRHCIAEHEREHLPDANCPAGFSRGGVPPGAVNREECNAYAIEIACYIKNRAKECGRLSGAQKAQCEADYRAWICDACYQMKNRYNCPPHKIPSNCRYC